MKHDRNLSFRTAECISKDELDGFLRQEHSKAEYEKLGIENPKFYYFITKEPLEQSDIFFEKIGKRDVYTREQSFFGEIFNHIKQNKDSFELKKIFYGNKPNANVYVYKILEKN